MALLVIVTGLIIVASVILILVVLVQNPKGGGLAAGFGGGGGGGGQFGGVAQTNKFLDKATWTLAIALLVFAIAASVLLPRNEALEQSKIQKALNEVSTTPVNNFPSVEEVKKQNETPATDEKAKDK